jgi:hypothetical protein
MSIRVWALGVVACASACMAGSATVSNAAASPMLGFESSKVLASNADSSPDTLAGSHPYALTVSFGLNTTTNPEGRLLSQGGDLRDLLIELPAGLVLDPLALPRCGLSEFSDVNPSTDEDACPNASAVGVLALESVAPSTLSERKTSLYPIYDLTPAPGSPALFGIEVAGVSVYLTPSIRSGSDYGTTLAITGIPQSFHALGSSVTLWGVPAEATHDEQRGDCIQSHATCHAGVSAQSLLTLPEQCMVTPNALLRADSWQEPGQFSAFASDPIADSSPTLTDCQALSFKPSFNASIESSTADSPTGLKLQVQMPAGEDPLAPDEANIGEASVTLAPGMTLNLARFGSLTGCPLDGAEGINLGSDEPSGCPQASKIGNAQIKTPILAKELEGGVYLAQQGNLAGGGSNPFKSLIAIYIVAEGSGVVVKLPAEVSANPQTGQLTVSVGPDPVTGQALVPQLPIEDVAIELPSGNEGLLVTPATCGSAPIGASLTPSSGSTTSVLTDETQISEGCAKAFSPSLSGGTLSKQANGYSTLTTTIALQAGEQELKSVSLTMPPGLLVKLTGVALCGEPYASLGTCPPESLIGEASSTVGAGPDPLAIDGGKVYLTGSYAGGPFGLSLVMPALAGPFNLGPEGRPVVIRAAIHVSQYTGQITISTDPEGAYSIPSILEGILPKIRSLDITINRPQFVVNPTKCAAQSIVGAITSAQRSSANVSTPFEAVNCGSLPFNPKLTVSTSGHPSRRNGIDFNVKIVDTPGQSNAELVKAELPKQLVSRLTTLQKACPVATFEANPASCPEGSIVGTARFISPILPVPLAGPAYFVGHGGAKFPELVTVLQGYGITIDLYGETFISRANITSSTFPRLPDVTVSSFELHLPAGKDSALAGVGQLCDSDIRMPTMFVAEDGAVLKEDPKVAVGGCPPTIKVIRHRVRHAMVSVVVSVPSAGTLTASGRGLTRAGETVKKATTITLRLATTKSTRRSLARHHKRGLKIAVKLSFLPNHGSGLSTHLTVFVH